jgi:hypothetical protein
VLWRTGRPFPILSIFCDSFRGCFILILHKLPIWEAEWFLSNQHPPGTVCQTGCKRFSGQTHLKLICRIFAPLSLCAFALNVLVTVLTQRRKGAKPQRNKMGAS